VRAAPIRLSVLHSEPAGVRETPLGGDRRDGVADSIASHQVLMCIVQSHAPHVLGRRGAEVAAEHVLHRPRRDVNGPGDVAYRDVGGRIRLDVLDGAAKQRRLVPATS